MSMSNITTEYQPIANRVMSIASQMQVWINEAAALESSAHSPEQKERLADLNSSLDSYSQLLEDIQLPNEPWIARSLKPILV